MSFPRRHSSLAGQSEVTSETIADYRDYDAIAARSISHGYKYKVMPNGTPGYYKVIADDGSVSLASTDSLDAAVNDEAFNGLSGTSLETVLLSGVLGLDAILYVPNNSRLTIDGTLTAPENWAYSMIKELETGHASNIHINGGGIINGHRTSRAVHTNSIIDLTGNFSETPLNNCFIDNLEFRDCVTKIIQLSYFMHSRVANIKAHNQIEAWTSNIYAGVKLVGVTESTLAHIKVGCIASLGDGIYPLELDDGCSTNQIIDYYVAGGSQILIAGAHHNTFLGCSINDTSNGGFRFTGASHGNRLIGGRMALTSGYSEGIDSAIEFAGTSHHNAVLGVDFHEEVGSSNSKYAVEEQDTADYNSVTGCIADGQVTGAWNLTGAHSVKTGNIPT